ncbi:hypothetical protein HP567_014990 [Brevibacillus sp. M2.1A]|uniref:hypothetical protein n=1 Tax=Brevibacillus sp. M2.1A TaxID=2738980 RepID=UPI00156B4814|nr:hypothetical protein [Brevibacillus sp. M2.1A]MCC8435847.1 hypothetical protein [Brevibacillus sp. M2.1A]
MGWAEFQLVPNQYNDECKKIDESILQLLRERKVLANGKRLTPPQEIRQEWAEKYGIDEAELGWFLHTLNSEIRPVFPDEHGELIGVLPIMKTTVLDGFTYTLTHAMQHKNLSIVHVEIKSGLTDYEDIGMLRPHLMLEIKSSQEHHVRKSGARGSERKISLQFMVSPALPDQLDSVGFSLTPYAAPRELPPLEYVLDKEVHFG